MTVTLTGGQATMLFLVMLRSLGLVFTAPIFGHHSVPTLVKYGLACALAIALAKTAGATAGSMPLIMAAPIELIIGMALGFAIILGLTSSFGSLLPLLIQNPAKKYRKNHNSNGQDKRKLVWSI